MFPTPEQLIDTINNTRQAGQWRRFGKLTITPMYYDWKAGAPPQEVEYEHWSTLPADKRSSEFAFNVNGLDIGEKYDNTYTIRVGSEDWKPAWESLLALGVPVKELFERAAKGEVWVSVDEQNSKDPKGKWQDKTDPSITRYRKVPIFAGIFYGLEAAALARHNFYGDKKVKRPQADQMTTGTSLWQVAKGNREKFHNLLVDEGLEEFESYFVEVLGD